MTRQLEPFGGAQTEERRAAVRLAWQADRARCGPRGLVREQSLWALGLLRLGQWGDALPEGWRRTALDRLYWPTFRMVELLTGIGISKLTAVGPGIRVYHFGGIFVTSEAQIGPGCTLRQGVTIGNARPEGPSPLLEADVDVGAYAQILGGIRIGTGARIGASAVVLQDVPAGGVAVGNPARVLPMG